MKKLLIALALLPAAAPTQTTGPCAADHRCAPARPDARTPDFLTVEEKACIFYGNAAKFLGLPADEIARHHR